LGTALACLLVLPAAAQAPCSGEPPLHANGAIPDTPETLRGIPRVKQVGSCNTGSKISAALDLLKTGAASLAEYPYSPRFCSPPPESLRASATDFRIDNWELVDIHNIDQIKAELYKKNPVIISLHDSASFDRLKAGQRIRIATTVGTRSRWSNAARVADQE